jgi:WD40 repeat protein
VWDVQSGNLIGTLTGHSKAVFSLEYTADGSHIVSGSEDETVRVWDVHSLSGCTLQPLDERCVTISASSNFSNIAAGTLRGELVSWRTSGHCGESSTISKKAQIHDDSTFCIQYLPGGDEIVTGSRDLSVKLWSCGDIEGASGTDTKPRPIREFLGHKVSLPLAIHPVSLVDIRLLLIDIIGLCILRRRLWRWKDRLQRFRRWVVASLEYRDSGNNGHDFRISG